LAALSAVNDLLLWHRLQSFITNGEDGAEEEPADIETILEMEKINNQEVLWKILIPFEDD
jgi:hypothetical protein